MSSGHNTLFFRLAGPMQSWGTSSRLQLRRTDAYPSKSGVLGMVLCAMGVKRENSDTALEPLNRLLMGVRVDRSGTLDWDYHTAGAKIGIRRADGKIKETASTHEYETLLSRRQYLYDASFLVALHGDADTITACARDMENPTWPLFLGRKCCIPAEPVFARTGSFDTLTDAFSSVLWQPRVNAIDRDDNRGTRTLDIYIEHPPGSKIPKDARLVYDVPRKFGFFSYEPRWVAKNQVTVAVGETIQRLQPDARRGDPYSKHFKEVARPSRLKLDSYLCVFCKSPAEEVHHVSYENNEHETDSDLRSLCEMCHDACTMLEYGRDMRAHRVDPSDPAQRRMILHQIERLLKERRHGQRRKLLRAARKEL
ncbi:MAG: type I-E CRISPR-associated protein Cas5/CasD [Deltaproteobacteria bacterium]|nr:type I-E CRISPR-associated protein Cas5/CasD [Deltaproteobacteria bacterium]